ncbi:protein-methionine-sulfoxide reductase heme-binding subunit MsrQ [Anianabacter salinae]|uniref:protein-methionine-sulfoxide reductase heme-binding subunit MsrQ n=1 Tax=Anianabacter salinae TaxID=2851023 RepID=UPI00225DFF04|nr:protein-methionine-sulfoxide reductase heme-binding subunit MsrQ [Anianabacter salinae]MBV0913763.1 protein-methionine-sulfoxide reductase heme-binding subunit MsrQ [Anianabacter salinae]
MQLVQPINTAVRRVPTWLVYALMPIPAAWWFWLGLSGGLGAEPIKALEHLYGELALQLLIAGLAITPLRSHAGINLIRFRRAIGLSAFFYVALHLLVWLVLDIGILSQIWADIVKRLYITIGMAGFAALVPLALTSNDWSVRRLGPLRWRKLHKLTYAAALLGGLHFILLVKGWQIEPLIYGAVIAGLLALRAVPRRGPLRSRTA